MSELYQLPAGWECNKLGNVLKLRSGKFLPKREMVLNGKFNVYGGNGINGTHNEFNLSGENIIIGRVGALCGNVRYVCESIWVTDNAFFVSEYLVDIDKNFLTRLLSFIELGKFANKAAQPVLSYSGLCNILLPLPPLTEQKRIVQKLDALFERIDKAIALLQKNINAADNFMNSVLNDVFQDLQQNHPMELLFKIADVNRGKSKHRPRNDKKLFGGNYPFIQTGDVRNASKYITSYSDTYSEFGLSQSKLWQKGTICMTIAANIGDVAILGVDSCFPDSVVGIFSESESNEYLYYYLLTLKKQLESKATTTAQMNINIKILQDIELPLPSIDIQKRTVKYLDCISDQIEQVKSAQQQKMQNLLDLKSSILDQAFHGKL